MQRDRMIASAPAPVGLPEMGLHDENLTYAAKAPGEGPGQSERGGRAHGVSDRR